MDRKISEETTLAINAMRAFTQDASGEPLTAGELAVALNAQARTVNMEGFALRLLRIMAELQTMQEERTTLLYQIDDFDKLLKDGISVELEDRTVSLRIDGHLDDDPMFAGQTWLELVDLKKPVAGEYGVYAIERIERAADLLMTARRYGTPHEISEAVGQAINELTEQR